MMSPADTLAFTNPDAKFFEDNLLCADDWAIESPLIANNSLSVQTTLICNDDFINYNGLSLANELNGLCNNDASNNKTNPFDGMDFYNKQIKEEPMSPLSFGSLSSSPEHELQFSDSQSDTMASSVCLSPISDGFADDCIVPSAPKKRFTDHTSYTELPLPQMATTKVPVCLVKPSNTVNASVKTENQTKPVINLINQINCASTTANIQLPLPTLKQSGVSSPAIIVKSGNEVIPNILQVNSNGLIGPTTYQNIHPTKTQGFPTKAINTLPTMHSSLSQQSSSEGTTEYVKAEKRQQRMIKNRESASQSRKRKKEYLQTLEERIHLLTTCNTELKLENENLKIKVSSLESANTTLKYQPSNTTDSMTNNIKKTTCLVAVLFLLTLNISNLRPSLGVSKQLPIAYSSDVHIGRHLLNVQDYTTISSKDVNYRNNVLDDLEATTSLHKKVFKSEILFPLKKESEPKNDRKDLIQTKRSKKGTKEGHDKHQQKKINLMSILEQWDCQTVFNKTDVSRITEALEGLVKQQLKSKQASKPHSNASVTGKLSENCTQNRSKKELYKVVNPRLRKPVAKLPKNEHVLTREAFNTLEQNKHDMVVYPGGSTLADSINREDDTFYVMSLRPDHFILPAKRYNDTQRPKVSFMLPATNDTGLDPSNRFVQLMQIDCHVVDMKVINVERSVLPKPITL